MDYRGIITEGYHVDAGGQNRIGIITSGYLGEIAEPVFYSSPRKIVASSENRIVSWKDERKIIATSGSRTVKGIA